MTWWLQPDDKGCGTGSGMRASLVFTGFNRRGTGNDKREGVLLL